ncbi:glucokinase [Caldalkalibacillus uzonensis]|uniref:Glucokinase n=1 Tax=Caldalkalibacillus uzonensis TaxID=353224 RepID=A0ABU0CRH1_9BACI|nr:ROK family protein [Caldalkalibacillus uzonensis]MDQ0338673.1 glucokinase [Caldalkalibacillus uzonensis]
MKHAIGIDIGGTKIATGIVDAYGQVGPYQMIPTDTTASPMAVINEIEDIIKELLTEGDYSPKDILGIGVCAPGPLEARQGRITCPPNLPKWKDIPIVNLLQERLSTPVILENDANAAALAEKWIGAAQDSEHFIYLTISTGIGAGLFLHGRLVTGARGNAGEVGHMVIDPTQGICRCGQRGCLEWLASGTAISRMASEVMNRDLTAEDVFVLYRQGHEQIVPLIDQVFTYIGMGCVNLINLFDPEKIVIGGGVSQAGQPLFDAVRNYVHRYALNPSGRKTEIVPAQLKQHVGLIGAAALIFHHREEEPV